MKYFISRALNVKQCISVISLVSILGFTAAKVSFDSDSTETTEAVDILRIQIPKCCPRRQVVSLDLNLIGKDSNITCVSITNPNTEVETSNLDGRKIEDWTPYFYTVEHIVPNKTFKFDTVKTVATNTNGDSDFVSFEYFVLNSCNISKIQTPHGDAYAPRRTEFRVATSGLIYTRLSGNDRWHILRKNSRDTQNYCVDGFLNMDSKATKGTGEFERTMENQILISCGDLVVVYHGNKTVSIIHLILMIVASVFLSLVVITHLLVWDTQNLHGWTVAMYSLSMLTFLVFKATADTFRLFARESGGAVAARTGYTTCFLFGITLHFFYIATFSWMAVLNFDLWATIVSMSRSLGRSEEKRRFLYYAAVGFGIPFIVVGVSIIIEFSYGYFDDTVYRPQYANTKCDLDKSAVLYYEVIISLVLFGFGILLSCFTIRFLVDYMYKARRVHQAMKGDSRYNMAKMFSKIFVLLAFSWIFEIAGICWSFTTKANRWYVILFDVHNWVQSIGFFWIFVCKKDIQEQLRQKYRIFHSAFSWLDRKYDVKKEMLTTHSSIGNSGNA